MKGAIWAKSQYWADGNGGKTVGKGRETAAKKPAVGKPVTGKPAPKKLAAKKAAVKCFLANAST